jgi:hypothetical protein
MRIVLEAGVHTQRDSYQNVYISTLVHAVRRGIYHSLYEGKSNMIDQTLSRGASITIEDETENTPSDARGGRLLEVIFGSTGNEPNCGCCRLMVELQVEVEYGPGEEEHNAYVIDICSG